MNIPVSWVRGSDSFRRLRRIKSKSAILAAKPLLTGNRGEYSRAFGITVMVE